MMKRCLFVAVLLLFSAVSFAAGEVLKLNTSGTQYCPGFKPFRFTPANDIDLYVRIDSDFSAAVFLDPALSVPVTDLSILASPITQKKFSFVAAAGEPTEFITVIGTLKIDAVGNIQSLTGTLTRRGFLNTCWSKGTVKGKRIN